MGKTHFSGPVLTGSTDNGQQQGVCQIVFKPTITALNTATYLQTFPEGALVKDVIAFAGAGTAAVAVTVKLGTAAGGVQVYTGAITGLQAINVRIAAGGSLYVELSVGATPPYALYITVIPL
jgi:hypothetical protein